MKSEDVGQWFLNGFKDWFNPKTHYEAFLPINTLATNRDITEQLKEIYNGLPEETRFKWQNGLASAVKICENEEVWMLPLRNIFILAKHLSAYQVIVEIRSRWIGEFHKEGLSNEAQQTKTTMINLLANWSDQPEAYNLLRDLLNRPYFINDPYLSDAPFVFIMMLEAKPEDMGELLDMARPLFNRMLKEKSGDEQKAFLSNFAESLLYQVPLSKLVLYFDQLKIARRPLYSQPKYADREFKQDPKNDDKWFIAALFGFDLNELDSYRIRGNDTGIPSSVSVKMNAGTRVLVDHYNSEDIILNEDNHNFGKTRNLFDAIYKNHMEALAAEIKGKKRPDKIQNAIKHLFGNVNNLPVPPNKMSPSV